MQPTHNLRTASDRELHQQVLIHASRGWGHQLVMKRVSKLGMHVAQDHQSRVAGRHTSLDGAGTTASDNLPLSPQQHSLHLFRCAGSRSKAA
eukprot:CAMPEP_0115699892 /NCGR_PEP_ID=MMETSP0272-20121206/67121_1 /TAXON_ID=71861 /ORGANISM="Scrippsiella trochoidea, Strain CCMP3099" /LENGTH=91 /DNA_ID=CAMNT_0003140347 /DNA_START=81 /DNA_END=354 /DNA_ORIENTATION=-